MSTRTARDRVLRAYARIDEANRPEVWISVRPLADALTEADAIDAAVASGQRLPLAGTTCAVKDNIDVAGIATTAGCPAYAYVPAQDAATVARLRAAGTVILGKTNLDQFATGLIGTRSPYGAVRSAVWPERVAGGSSSGSAVAVALGIADFALGTDTAGSGRVPAAFQAIVGVKPTRGLLPMSGVVPAVRGLDCVSVFAADIRLALRAVALMSTPDPDDPYSREWPPDAPLAAPAQPRVAVAGADQLVDLTPEAFAQYEQRAAELEKAGAVLVTSDIAPLLAAAGLLYDGSFVAARYASVGSFIDSHPDEVDPIVGQIIRAARDIPAHRLVHDEARIAELSARTRELFTTVDALLMPTAPRQPLLSEVAADPFGVNARLGAFTNFCNLLDLSAIAVPAGEADGGHFGVTVFAPAFHDAIAADIAMMLEAHGSDGHPESAVPYGPPGIELAVFGAHLRGHPLNHQLTGARLLGPISTAPSYRMFRLGTVPAKPGLVRVEQDGNTVTGELWSMPEASLARLLAELGPPMTLGAVELADGREVVGFLCQPYALAGAQDITSFTSWPRYLAGR